MGWATMVGRRSPWSDLENCRRALDSFCREEGLPQGTVPSLYYMQQAKRYDLCTAVRHWGGLSRLARTLGYQVSSRSPAGGLGVLGFRVSRNEALIQCWGVCCESVPLVLQGDSTATDSPSAFLCRFLRAPGTPASCKLGELLSPGRRGAASPQQQGGGRQASPWARTCGRRLTAGSTSSAGQVLPCGRMR